MLQAVIIKESNEAIELEVTRFKSNLVAAHPDLADSIFGEEELEQEETEEEQGFSAEDITHMLNDLQQFGLALHDDGL